MLFCVVLVCLLSNVFLIVAALLNMIKFVIECSFIRAFEDALKQLLMTDFTRFSSCFSCIHLMLLLYSHLMLLLGDVTIRAN